MAFTFNGNQANYASKAITFSANTGTLMAWVQIATDRNSYSTFFYTNDTDNEQFVVQTDASGTRLGCYIYDNAVTGTDLTVGTWYHLAVTWDGSSARVYLNGTLDITNTATGSDWTQVWLGRSTSFWDEPLNGNIAHVKAWNATLSQSEISAERYVINAVRTSNLIGQWPTPEGANRANDTSGNGNNFTLNGTITDYANPLVNGVSVAALGSLTGSSAAKLDIAASAAVTLGSATSAATATIGNSTVEAIAAASLAPMVGTAAATLQLSGAVAATLGSLLGTAAASVEDPGAIHAEASAILGSLTSNASAVIAFIVVLGSISGPGGVGVVVGSSSIGTVNGASGQGTASGARATGTASGPGQ
jgi:hypothetical protein